MVNDLAQRIEQASAEQQRKVLFEAYVAIFPYPENYDEDVEVRFLYNEKRNVFFAMLDAQAWLSAAEMLVPSGWLIVGLHETQIADLPLFEVRLSQRDASFGRARVVYGNANNPALALAAAALRAHISENPDAG